MMVAAAGGRVTATRTGPTSENDRASGAPSATDQGGGNRRGKHASGDLGTATTGRMMASVAISPDIRTRTLRPWYAPIKPSRMLTLRTADCLQSSLATENFRSISIGPWCSCSLGRSDFSRTDILVLIEVFTSAVELARSLHRRLGMFSLRKAATRVTLFHALGYRTRQRTKR
jgi:hypothetical protein